MRTGTTLAVLALAIFAGTVAAIRPDLAVALIGLAALAVLMLAGPKLLAQATIFIAITTLPTVVPNAVPVGPLAVNVYEPFLAVLTLRLIASARTLPKPARNGLAALALLVVFGAVVGLINGAETRWIIFDTRGLLTVAAAATSAAYISTDKILWTSALRTIKACLWISAAFTIPAALGIIDVGGRTEDAGLYLDGRESASGATRLLTDATHVSLAVLCVSLAAAITQRSTFRPLLPYILPALLVTTFSFSRNALLALGLAAVVSVLFAGTRGVTGAIRATVGLAVAGSVLVGFTALVGGEVWDFTQTQWQGYSSRVVSGVSSDVRARDASTLQRLAENEATTAAIGESPAFGHGFGYAYRPAFGPSGTFAGDEGRFYTHNYYYWMGVKTGLIGIALFLWVTLRPAIHGLRRPHVPLAVALISMMAVSVVAPLPLSTESSGSVTMGALMGVCLALMPPRVGRRPKTDEERVLVGSSV